MKDFNYFAPTEIVYGAGAVSRAGAYTAAYGQRALLVTVPAFPAVAALYATVKESLEAAGLAVAHFDGVIPNPTVDVVADGVRVARAFGADVVVGLGGGSAMDTAKAIAVGATHPGTVWDYLHYTAGPTAATLPIVCVGTTAGTGSQTTPCAVITKTESKDKSAIWHRNIFPKVAIVDPEATMTMPPSVTAQTGFDAFCHNFEAYLSVNSNPLVEALALDAIKRVVQFLPRAVTDGGDREARAEMAWADTLGGLTNASAGVTLPHGLGMQVGGHCPHVTHGQALAIIYPAFTRFTYPSAVAKFAAVGRIFDPSLAQASDECAAEQSCIAIDDFLKRIGLWIGFQDVNVTMADIRQIADCGQVLGDYKNNPRVATIDEMYALLTACYERGERP
ncbi:MAG: iron-containing alcohol dehydrogenase [Oscillospiraceae bacterium]|jgi:alcohol dehydrogenase class IV|nr:iron-containing alcohol dehydrogenase [Oscillospiraceae bacterium]